MNEHKLSKRLTAVVNQVTRGSKLADIGSDHAYLPCYAVLSGLISKAIAGEVNRGPFDSAIEQVRKLGLQDKIDVRKGNGLEVLQPSEVDVITIAGMGGTLITTILDEGIDKLAGVKRLVLQPNVSAIQVRKWLRENNWGLTNEEILEEDGVIYEVLTADFNDKESPYSNEHLELELLVGPFLLKQKKPEFKKKWQQEIEGWKRVLKQFELATSSTEVEQKKSELLRKIQSVEEVLGE
ncbi:MAG: tRNA (adenine(22)-N(1))-methyltransferase TrmK [Bacillaceae bacterium]|nr:tRNA (adenine(22)-N(1))-methyltransferase TrmK [Bacillaceae bacterium]